MADETTTTVEQPVQQAYDIGSRTMAPATPPTTESATETKPDAAKPETTTTAEKPAETATPPADKPKTDNTTTTAPDFNAHLKEKYAIESEDKLVDILSSNKTLQEKVKALETAPKEPQFATEQDKAAYEFIKQYPPSRFGEGLQAYTGILNMDVAKADGKLVMKEAFLLSKPELTREKAEKLFEADFKRRYALDKESFKTDEEFKEAQELADIDKEERELISRKTLSEKQAQLKKQAETPKQEDKKPEEPKLPESAQGYLAKVNEVKMDKLAFTDPTNEKVKYNIPVPADRMKAAQEFANMYLKDTRLYDKDGKIPNFDANKVLHIGLMILDPDWYMQEHVKQVTSLARTIQAEQIAGTKPDKESKGGGDGSGIPDIATQFKELGEKAKQERAQGR